MPASSLVFSSPLLPTFYAFLQLLLPSSQLPLFLFSLPLLFSAGLTSSPAQRVFLSSLLAGLSVSSVPPPL